MSTEKRAGNYIAAAVSLRARVFWLSLIWIAMALVATGYVLNQFFEQHVRQQYQQQLQVYADYVLASVEPSADGLLMIDQSPQSPRFLQPLSGLYWQINNQHGQTVLRSRSLWDQKIQAPSDVLSADQSHFHMVPGPDGGEVLLLEQIVRFETMPSDQWRLLVAEDSQAFRQSVDDWQQMLSIFLFVLFICLSAATLAQIVFGFSPLRRLQANMRHLQSGDIRRIDGTYPSEFASLVDGFNGVLDANERIVERARAQAGDLAHAIKTPLTIMSTALDQANVRQDVDAELAGLMREQIAMMHKQVQWRLRQSRIAAQYVTGPVHACQVEPVIDQMLRVIRKLYAERGIRFEQNIQYAEVRFFGESQDLAEMLGNLLDNAGKWAVSLVTVSVTCERGQFVLEVQDDGPGIQPNQYSKALTRGRRLDESAPGSGLGLAITNDLVQLYQGEIELESSDLGGLLARLRLPGQCK